MGYFSYQKLALRQWQINNAMLLGLFFRCSSPIPCSQFEQNKIQTKENNKNKTDDHNKQVNESGPLTNRRSFEQIINLYDVMGIFSIGIPCYIIILFIRAGACD